MARADVVSSVFRFQLIKNRGEARGEFWRIEVGFFGSVSLPLCLCGMNLMTTDGTDFRGCGRLMGWDFLRGSGSQRAFMYFWFGWAFYLGNGDTGETPVLHMQTCFLKQKDLPYHL